MPRSLLKIATLFFSVLALTSCGGGSGDEVDFSVLQGAEIALAVSDSVIALGDRVEVAIDVSTLTDQAALIKVRYPDTLKYIDDTARLEADDVSTSISPDLGPRRSSDDELIYLIFDISKLELGQDESGIITFQLRGQSEDLEAHLEVDTDIHESGKTVGELFKISAPLFRPEDSITIRIK